ncbi:MAG TPA: polysaccharide lyase family 7 protein [Polyangia bacterium]
MDSGGPPTAGAGGSLVAGAGGGARAGGAGGNTGTSATAGATATDAGGEAGVGEDGGAEVMDGGAGKDAGPPRPFDLSIWLLQLPIGSGTSPITVAPPALATFSNIYFYRADDGGQMFMDPATGITTSGSVHPRTELRESNATGGAADWSPAGTNTMTVTGKVTKGGRITIAQVFNGPQSIPLGELQYSSSGFTLLYEEAKGGGVSTGLGNAVPLNSNYTFTMGLSKNVLTVSINGKQVYSHTPSAAILGSKFYFKVGNYDQTSTKGTPGTTANSIVEVYGVDVAHQ